MQFGGLGGGIVTGGGSTGPGGIVVDASGAVTGVESSGAIIPAGPDAVDPNVPTPAPTDAPAAADGTASGASSALTDCWVARNATFVLAYDNSTHSGLIPEMEPADTTDAPNDGDEWVELRVLVDTEDVTIRIPVGNDTAADELYATVSPLSTTPEHERCYNGTEMAEMFGITGSSSSDIDLDATYCFPTRNVTLTFPQSDIEPTTMVVPQLDANATTFYTVMYLGPSGPEPVPIPSQDADGLMLELPQGDEPTTLLVGTLTVSGPIQDTVVCSPHTWSCCSSPSGSGMGLEVACDGECPEGTINVEHDLCTDAPELEPVEGCAEFDSARRRRAARH